MRSETTRTYSRRLAPACAAMAVLAGCAGSSHTASTRFSPPVVQACGTPSGTMTATTACGSTATRITAAAPQATTGGFTFTDTAGAHASFTSNPPMPNYPAGDAEATLVDTLEGLTPATFAVEGADFDPRLTPDGKFLVFSSTQHRPTSDIYFKPVGSRTVTQLTADPANDVMPSVSPDGNRIAFCSDRNGTWQIFLMGARGGRAVQLTNERTHDLHPSWSPDGTKLVFSRLGEVSGRWELWVLNVDQPASPEFIGFGMFPEWCPVASTGFNGADRILFQRGRERGDRAFGLWTIDYKPGDASTPTEVVRSERNFAAINPAWSPDGQFLAYATVPVSQANAPGKPSQADLWVTGIDGAGKVNLTSGRFANLMPNWGKNGRVYFVSDRSGSDAIWSVGTEKALAAMKHTGGEARPVANVPEKQH